MPTSTNAGLPLVPPPNSRPVHAYSPPPAEKKAKKEDTPGKTRGSSSEWVDIEEDKPRRRRKVKRTGSAVESSRIAARPPQKKSTDLGRFFPKLSQILESSESKTPSKPRQSDPRTYPSPKSPNRRRSSGLQKQDSLLSLNASLLSVISDLTAATSRSSGSNSTVTQRSYSRRPESVHRRGPRGYRTAMSDTSSIASSGPRAQVSYEYSDVSDARSIMSSSTASQHDSESGSSDAPATPSSSSTYPSPLHSERRHDSLKQALIPTEPSVLSSMTGSDISAATAGTYESSLMNEPQFFYREPDPPGHEGGQPLPAPLPAHPSAFSPQYFEEMHRSRSQSSSDQQQALQHYYTHPTVEDDTEQALQHERYETSHPLAVPDAPDLAQVTVVGYEKLARELSKDSEIKPLYRKFGYLNHRILLYLQDEIAELEEQLRRDDEIIAQLGPANEGRPIPSSRRGDAYYGLDIHHHRTALLGRIFIKTEQYNKAMSAYSSMVKDCTPASTQDITQYKDWMSKETPIHEIETNFLRQDKDLVSPGGRQLAKRLPIVVIVLSTLAAVLPAMLVATVPTLAGRIVTITVTAVAMIGLKTATKILQTVSTWDTLACALAFVLITTTMAICVPQHTAID